MKKVLLVALLLACGASYGVEYTKEQLNKMIADGKPPKEAEADFSAEKAEFSICKKSAKEIVQAAGAHYPVQVVSDNNVLYRAKIWANDGSMTVRCDAATGLMTMAQAKYK